MILLSPPVPGDPSSVPNRPAPERQIHCGATAGLSRVLAMREEYLSGRDALAAVTELLQRVRVAHPIYGL